MGLPVGDLVVLEELAPDVLASAQAVKDRVHDPRGTIDDVQGRVEVVLLPLSLCVHGGVLVSHPACVRVTDKLALFLSPW